MKEGGIPKRMVRVWGRSSQALIVCMSLSVGRSNSRACRRRLLQEVCISILCIYLLLRALCGLARCAHARVEATGEAVYILPTEFHGAQMQECERCAHMSS